MKKVLFLSCILLNFILIPCQSAYAQCPVPYAVTGGGSYCGGGAGSNVYLSNSETGVDYSIYKSSTLVTTVHGTTGSSLTFSGITSAGVYTIKGTNISSSCTTNMIGSATVTILPLPTPYTLSGGGSYCIGSLSGVGVGLSNSDIGVNYDLFINGSYFSTKAGTGGSLSFPGMTAVGIYTIKGTIASTGCTGNMSGSKTVSVQPLPNKYAVSTGGSYCAGGPGVDITLSGSEAGFKYYLYNGATLADTAHTGTGAGIDIGFHPAGSYIIKAINPTTGCMDTMTGTATVTAIPLPAAITGTTTLLCVAATTTLSDATTGGTWSSSNSAVATAGTGGVITGIGAGTATISYTATTGCSATMVMTVVATAGTISGPGAVCPGNTITLSDAITGGAWSTATGGAASVGTGSGIVTGISAGTAVISYTYGCIATKTITVNVPAAAISGPAAVCPAQTIALSDAVTGGTWNSPAGTVSVGTATGMVTGISPGTAAVTYTTTGGCTTATTVTVLPAISNITGPGTVCFGQTITLSDGTAGGTWVSGSTTIATVGSGTGVVTGVIPGTVMISYVMSSGCAATTAVTVNPAAGPISGNLAICTGQTTALSDAGGGTWMSSNPATGSINTLSGVATGLLSGTTTITYNAGGCTTTTTLTVSTAPAPITGAANLCTGTSTFLSDAVTGGTWSSTSTNISIGTSTGLVAGVGIGTAMTTYRTGPGCQVTWAMTVNTMPAAITGSSNVCSGSTITLSNIVTGGTWSSPNTTVSVSAGLVTGLAAGTATISYTLTGCTTTTIIRIDPQAAITGGSSVCVGATVALSTNVAGGTWSSDNTGVATVSGGVVTGVALGTATISYALTTGCNATRIITVSTTPTAITGAGSVCAGATTPLTDAVGGGTWASSAMAQATVDGAGVVTGVAQGTTTITYSLGSGCTVTKLINVNALPTAITGLGSVCAGAMTQLTDATAGGSWSSDNVPVATISSGGLVKGIVTGTATISYQLISTGCAETKVITVSNAPTGVTGPGAVCTGNTIVLSNAVSGGTWLSGSPAIATIDAFGTVTGASTGTAMMTYSMGGGCIATKLITVAPVLGAITGTATVCAGSTTVLSNTTSGGIWSVDGSGKLSTGGGPAISGVIAGTGMVTYTVVTTGCMATRTVTVNPLPNTITGTTNICYGATATLSDAGGGAWSTTASAVSVGAVSGVVTGLSVGTGVVTYTLPVTGCKTTTLVQVYPVPGAITGIKTVCDGSMETLRNTTPGGAWLAGTGSGVAIVSSSTGDYYGAVQGTMTITYTIGPGCAATTTVTIYPRPAAITGSANLCVGSSVLLSTASTGGAWTSGNTEISVSSGGVVTGVATGTGRVTYTLPTGCATSSFVMTVNAPPAAITGAMGVCEAGITQLSDATAGGIWIAAGGATIDIITGMVTGVSAGTATITYALVTGCIATGTFTVYPLPTAITGAITLCMGSTGTLSNGISGGAWEPVADTIVNIDAVTGGVTGLKQGTTPVTYTTANGCSATTTVTVHVLPNIYSMMGGGSFCAGDTGVHVILAGTIIGTKYDLYNGTTLVTTVMGTNKVFDFGLMTTPGKYTAIATETVTTCQSKMDTSATVVVNPLMPTAVGITPTPSAIVCAGTPVLYTAVPVNGGAMPFYEWKVNGVSYGTGGTTYGYTPMKGDIVSLKMTSSVVCPSPMVIYGFLPMTVVDSIPPIVTIKADPGVHVATGQPVTLTATVTNGITGLSYQWSVNGAAIAGATDNTYTESNPADHEVVSCAVMSNATCMTSDEESVELSIGAEGVAPPAGQRDFVPGGLSVYPSPASQHIAIVSSVLNGVVRITDVTGRCVDKVRMTAGSVQVNVSKLVPGVYMVEAVDPSTGLRMTGRFVKE